MMVSVAILAGGQSRRMGHNKALLPLKGRPVLEWVIERVRPLTDDLLLSTNSPEVYRPFGLRMEGDVYPNKAALGGIYSAISAAKYPHVLVVACDMPFLNPRLLAHLMSLADSADVIVPVIDPPQPETTHAIYSRICLPAIKKRLLANKLRVTGFFEDVTVRTVSRQEVLRFDPDLYSFINANTPAEWEQVKQLADVV